MQLELRRIELREVIRWGEAIEDADEELLATLKAISVGAKIVEGAGATQLLIGNKTVKLGPTSQPRSSGDGDERPPKPPPGESGIEYLVFDERMEAQGWTQEEVDVVNKQREITVLSQRRAMERHGNDPSVGELTREFPAGYGIRHTAVGKKNAVGDTCIGLTDAGYSIFKCKETEHPAYADENPVRPGCPTCFMGGGSGAATSEAQDRHNIKGEEPF